MKKLSEFKLLIGIASVLLAINVNAIEKQKEDFKTIIVDGIYNININRENNVLANITVDKENIYINADILSDKVFSKFSFDNNTIVKNGNKVIYFPLSIVDSFNNNDMSISILLNDAFFDKEKTPIKLVNYKNRFINGVDKENVVNYINNNYQLNYDNLEKFSGYLETNYSNKNYWTVQNKLVYRNSNAKRIKTIYKKEFSDKSSLQLGDISEDNYSQLSSVNGLGVKYSTNYFNNNTNFNLLESLPQYSINGFSITPSLFSLYSNSNRIISDEISSGNYNIVMPFKPGYGVYDGYVKDYLGNVQQFNIPYYNTNKLLDEKRFEYSVSMASLRKNQYLSSFEYEKPFASGVSKYGVNKQWTQDFGMHVSSYYKNIYTAANFYIQPQWGLFQLGINHNGDNQQLYSFSWELISSLPYTFKISTMFSTDDNGFCINYLNDCIKKQNRFLVGYKLPQNLGQVSFQTLLEDKSNTSFVNNSIRWNKTFNANANLTVIYEQTKNSLIGTTPYKNNKLMMFLVYRFDDRFTGSTNYQNNSNYKYSSAQTRINMAEDKNNPEQGYGYVSINNNSNDSNPGYNLNYGANLKHFSYNVQSTYANNFSYNKIGMRGGVLYIPEDNKILFNKNTNGVILVDTNPQPNQDNSGLEIYHQNKLSGLTDDNGQYTIVNAIPYSKEKIELNLKTLPLDRNYDVFKKEIVVPYYGAAKVKFNQIMPDSIIFIKNLPPGAIFKINDSSFVVGEKGESSIDKEGLAIFESNDKSCSFEIKVEQKEYECK